MKKIMTLFKRGEDGLVYNEVSEGAEWVSRDAGRVRVSRMYDGVPILFLGLLMYKRHVIEKEGEVPFGFWVDDDVDPNTGKQVGWVVVGNGPEDRWCREAWRNIARKDIINGATYELCGPEINGNPERFPEHVFMRHGREDFVNVPRSFMGLRQWLGIRDIEGLVFYHPDGQMAKIKKVDFGLRRDEFLDGNVKGESE